MRAFQIGDKVAVLDDDIVGTVIQIEEDKVTITDDDGFDFEFLPRELVKIDGSIQVSNFDVAQILKEKETKKPKHTAVTKPKQRAAPKMEVDLHIHQLTNSVRGMTNFDMLNLQLETAKRQLEFAISKRIQKVVFIHGVGAGVLKEELKYLFKKYQVDVYDADFQKYGLGATEVYIYQNP